MTEEKQVNLATGASLTIAQIGSILLVVGGLAYSGANQMSDLKHRMEIEELKNTAAVESLIKDVKNLNTRMGVESATLVKLQRQFDDLSNTVLDLRTQPRFKDMVMRSKH